jgi:phosphoglycolate phosphatase
MNYPIYLFDFDYTLANSEKGIVGCFQIVLSKNGYPTVPVEEIKRTIGLPMKAALSTLTRETAANILEELRRKYSLEADKIMTKSTFLYPETVPTLTKIKSAGSKIGIISTKTRSRIMETLALTNLDKIVDLVLGIEDVSEPKPSPEGIYKAINIFNGTKTDVLYTGDSLIDAHAAKNAAVDFAAVTTGTTTANEFIDLPHKAIMKSLNELLLKL